MIMTDYQIGGCVVSMILRYNNAILKNIPQSQPPPTLNPSDIEKHKADLAELDFIERKFYLRNFAHLMA